MRCPFCGSQDIRSYVDRDYDLPWYLCLSCRYQGYDLTLFHDAYANHNACITQTSPIEGVKTKKK